MAARLSEALYVVRGLESQVLEHSQAIQALAANARHITEVTLQATEILSQLESDQKSVASDAKARAQNLARDQADALNELANAQVAANQAHHAAENAKLFQVRD